MSIVKLFNLFNPNVNICCSYVAKYVFLQYFPNATENGADCR